MRDLVALISSDAASDADIIDSAQSLLVEMLGSTALKAHRHPLGFVHVAVRDIALRLHIWPVRREPQDLTLSIHDHVFSFVSRVLIGSLVNVEYDVIEASDAEHELYFVKYDGDRSLLVASGQFVHARPRSQLSVSSFGQYAIATGTFHQSIPEAGRMVCTLVAPTVSASGQPSVVGPRGSHSTIAFERSAVEDTLLRGMLATILDELRRLQAGR